MKKSNELKYDIIACYNPREDETYHFLVFKDSKEASQNIKILVNYSVKFSKVCPDYEIPSYTDFDYDPKSNKIYMFLKSKGNPYGLKNKKNIKINLNNIKENLK